MFEISRQILDFFYLVLEILFDFALDIIYKSSRFFQTLLEKSFRFFFSIEM